MHEDESPSRDVDKLTDQSLMRRFRQGQEDAATALYTRYAQRLMKLANRQVYDDIANRVDKEGIVQSVFRTFFRRASEGHYDVAEEDALWKLLLVIALNKIRSAGSYHRAARRNAARTRSLTDDPAQAASLNTGEAEALAHLQITIDELVGQLPEDQQTIILMRIEGHGVNEIARESGRAKRTVERILQRFRRDLEAICDME
jgi:RNA polymerase sigma-70 factor (ECF subfamily)